SLNRADRILISKGRTFFVCRWLDVLVKVALLCTDWTASLGLGELLWLHDVPAMCAGLELNERRAKVVGHVVVRKEKYIPGCNQPASEIRLLVIDLRFGVNDFSKAIANFGCGFVSRIFGRRLIDDRHAMPLDKLRHDVVVLFLNLVGLGAWEPGRQCTRSPATSFVNYPLLPGQEQDVSKPLPLEEGPLKAINRECAINASTDCLDVFVRIFPLFSVFVELFIIRIVDVFGHSAAPSKRKTS